jgi:Uma2 family endonuclease
MNPAPLICDPKPFSWSADTFLRAGEAGIFGDLRVELVEGEVLQMSPMGNPHTVALMLLYSEASQVVGNRYTFLFQGPLAISDKSQLYPDAAILSGMPRDYKAKLPQKALLIIEISESTLNFDRTVKARIYAAAGIPEYWIINLVNQQIEVLRKPTATDGYSEKILAKSGDRLSPVATPEMSFEVANLLP